MNMHRRIYAAINLDGVAYNCMQMKQTLPEDTRMVIVVKADGYGHGAVPIARTVEPYDYVWGFGVATVEEGIELRKAGIYKPVLLLGSTFPEQYMDVVKHDLRPTIFQLSMARALSETAQSLGKTAFVHIAVDTGMSRIGVADERESIGVILDIASQKGIEIEGIFSHFARADEEDRTFAYAQLERFRHFLEEVRDAGIEPGLCHISNSAGIMGMEGAHMDLVRAGISIYGLYPSTEIDYSLSLVPVMELKSHITYIKTVKKGTQISYGGTYTASSEMRIATIPVGYGDGYPRSLSGKGYVLIRGHRAPILGRICMDQFMVDVTGIPDAAELDLVTLLGLDEGESLTMEYLGELSGRFYYEFACGINKRVPRVYKRTKQK